MAQVTRLTPDDVERYQAIRREMLLEAPWAFGSAPGFDRTEDGDAMRASLAKPEHAIFGACTDGELVSVAGVIRNEGPKLRHRAFIWGVYTTPEQRGKGYSRFVVEAAIALAKTWDGLHAVDLCVTESAASAIALYESLGFERWGTEPEAMLIDGELISEHHMRLVLR
ncbi:MAG: GNAT family N-acetyltransferase [Planctomycetota bacterium]